MCLQEYAENWLTVFAHQSIKANFVLLEKVMDSLQERALDPSRYPSQVLCLTEQIRFCSDVEKCLASLGGSPIDQLAAYKRQLVAQQEKLTSMLVDEPVLQLKLKALVLDLIHHIGIIDQLIGADNNGSIGCWTWQKQLRFYLVRKFCLTDYL